jgi:hypothetical protein
MELPRFINWIILKEEPKRAAPSTEMLDPSVQLDRNDNELPKWHASRTEMLDPNRAVENRLIFDPNRAKFLNDKAEPSLT